MRKSEHMHAGLLHSALAGFPHACIFYNPQRNKLNKSRHCLPVKAAPPVLRPLWELLHISTDYSGQSAPQGMRVAEGLLSQGQFQLLLL